MSTSKKDYIYNLLYQIFILLFPIILTPYTSRVLGAYSIGIYSFLSTIASYFIMFAKLGCDNLGERKIAKSRNNSNELSKAFFSIYYIQFFMSIIMSILFLIVSFLFLKDNLAIALIKCISVFAVIFEISWVFSGLEKFKLNITRNIVIKILTFILIIIFVKNSDDLWKYALILSTSSLITNLLWIFFIKKEIKFVKIDFKDILSNLKPSVILFLPILARSLYISTDKLMLGGLTSMVEVGFYEQASKFMKIPYVFTNALSTMMTPKNSYLLANKKEKKVEQNIEKSMHFIMFLVFPIAFGIVLISDNAIPLFLGNDFLKSSNILKILIISTIFVSFASILSSQYLIPNEKDKVHVTSTIIGAIINTTINLLLIPKLKSIGAAIGTFVTEFIIMIYVIIKAKTLNLKKYLLISLDYLIKALIMFAIGYLINFLYLSNLLTLILKIAIGVSIYLLLNINYIKKILKN